MNYKVKKVLKDNKKSIIIIAILWLILAIVFVAPIAYSIVQSKTLSGFNLQKFFETVFPSIAGFSTIGKVFAAEYIGTFGSILFYFSIIYLIFAIVGLVKSKPKSEYEDIEHGSSDWSEGGEQYRILSKNNGILLADKNFLPINKRGNVNVLVVGRFWFW